MDSFFTLHSFLEVGKTQDLPSKFWKTLGDALMRCVPFIHFAIRKKINHTSCLPQLYMTYHLSIIFYLSVKRSHHVRREGLEIPALVQKKRRTYAVGFYEDLKV
jgi:hypothetical protein